MADCKIISATAKAQVASVDDGAKTATAAVKEITANIKDISVTSAVSNHCLEARLKGFGEEWIPDTRKFVYAPEILELVEAVALGASRPLFDSVSRTDTLSKSSGKHAVDALATADNLTVSSDKTLEESPQTADSLVVSSDKIFKESTQPVSDVLLKGIGRVVADSVGATDDFLGMSNIDDDQTAAFIKVLADTRSILETHTRLISSAKTETINADEDIKAFVQNYFTSDYAPYGYVGSAYTL